jgi:hypothetical protein
VSSANGFSFLAATCKKEGHQGQKNGIFFGDDLHIFNVFDAAAHGASAHVDYMTSGKNF